MRWVQGCGILFALAFVLFAVPARFEGPVLVPLSPGHGLALIDVVALVPLLGGLALLASGLGGVGSGWMQRLAAGRGRLRAGPSALGLGLVC